MERFRRGITRSEMLKLSALGSATLLLPFGQAVRAARVSSPTFTPYTRELLIPETLQSLTDPSTTPYDSYNIVQKRGKAEIIPGYTTPIWGYNGLFPGPTIKARHGRILVGADHGITVHYADALACRVAKEALCTLLPHCHRQPLRL
jgi:spore coat protein A, manganese oxidase